VIWAVFLIPGLLLGDLIALPFTRSRPKQKKIVSTRVGLQVPASLVIAKLKGWPAQWEQDVASQWEVRFRGAGAAVAGLLAVTADELYWSPNRTWWRLGAREWLVKRSDVHHLEVLPVGEGSGITLSLKDGSQIWLWVAARRSFPLVTEHLVEWR
jgi:hypothetical protein